MDWTATKNQVVHKLGEAAFESLNNYVLEHPPSLWATGEPRNYTEKANVAALYKDLNGIGYGRLEETLNIGADMPHTSMNRNQRELRRCWKNWAEETMAVGDLREWKQAARHIRKDPKFPKGVLWEDSVDFARQKQKGMGRKSTAWSWKLNKPGQRYMVLVDGKSRIRKIWGGYSPKIYDSDMVTATRDWYEEHLEGAGVYADAHFTKATKTWRDPVFYTPIRLPRETTEREDETRHISDEDDEGVVMDEDEEDSHGAGAMTFTAKQRAYNRAQHGMRARVELPFAQVKNKWSCLQSPWAEDMEQLDCVVFTAFAVWTVSRG